MRHRTARQRAPCASTGHRGAARAQPRPDLLKLAAASAGLGAIGLAGCALNPLGMPDTARVLVVGGGCGGATAAKYVRLLSHYKVDVVLVEPEAALVSCPMSNLVLGALHGVRVVRDRVARIDPAQRVAVLASGSTLRHDELMLSPGIETAGTSTPRRC